MDWDICEHDTTCVRCGRGISFEVGPDFGSCPHCGGDYERTDEQIANDDAERVAERAKLNDPVYWQGEMLQRLKSEISYIEMIAHPDTMPEEALRMLKWLKNEYLRLEYIITNGLGEHFD